MWGAGTEIPDWLEAARAEDGGAAYEAAPAEWRARLKTAIAFQVYLHGESPDRENRTRRSRAKGFASAEISEPAAWTLAVLAPGWNAPARLLAAVLPAFLAGVRRILVVSLDQALSPGVQVALELAGLEDAFILSEAGCLRLLDELTDRMPEEKKESRPSEETKIKPEHGAQTERTVNTEGTDGRLLLFAGGASPASLTRLEQEAKLRRIPTWRDRPAPVLRPAGKDKNSPERETLLRAHGDAIWLEPDAPARFHARPDACWSPDARKDGTQNPPAGEFAWSESSNVPSAARTTPLHFGPGMEACWFFEDLPPAFFRRIRLSALLIPDLTL